MLRRRRLAADSVWFHFGRSRGKRVLAAAWILWKFIQRRRFLHQLEVARITPEELFGRMDAGENPYIVDLRSGVENGSNSVPGAIRLSVEELTANSKQIPRDREIILFCS